MNEFCIRYGIECQTLPPFRAEEKPLVERAIGMIQENYKSHLRGRGVIGDDVIERWATDYRKQAILTLDEYTAIVIHCIVALNTGRVLTDIGHLPIEAPNTPAKLWAWLKEKKRSRLLDVDPEEVRLRSLPRNKAKVTRKGISHKGMRYLPESGNTLAVGTSVEFAYDTSNSAEIYVLGANGVFLPCSLAPSSSRYEGYGLPDAAMIRQEEMLKERTARADELTVRIKMHQEIRAIVEEAEAVNAQKKDIKGITDNREQERSHLP